MLNLVGRDRHMKRSFPFTECEVLKIYHNEVITPLYLVSVSPYVPSYVFGDLYISTGIAKLICSKHNSLSLL